MVKGLDKFREAFANFSDNYVIIGGTACDVILSQTDMRPRVTDDIDMILVVEKVTAEFVSAFWQFIKEGEYKNRKRVRSNNQPPVYELYRFEGGREGYPAQIELLSKHSDLLGDPSGFHIEPIVSKESISSLSAIILDDDYYTFTVRNSFVEDNLRFASPVALICLKAKAFLNLSSDREQGKKVNSNDIKKHRNDVLKLIATMPFSEEPIPVTPSIYQSIQEYIRRIEAVLKETPNSLEDALQRSKGDIKVYLSVLAKTFIPYQG